VRRSRHVQEGQPAGGDESQHRRYRKNPHACSKAGVRRQGTGRIEASRSVDQINVLKSKLNVRSEITR
ncbi:MAG: hypothetical protein JW891_09185, partial [Candidatus Lokiarchaeota archaeon]|nr:hypothetical protein [Candidatus Lokiarchaeota archaeon]